MAPFSSSLLGRLLIFVSILIIDFQLLTAIPHQEMLGSFGSLKSVAVVSFAVFVGLGYSKLKLHKESIPFSYPLLGAHLLCWLAICVGVVALLHGFSALVNSVVGGALRLVAIAVLALACLPLKTWIAAVKSTSPSWLFASLAGIIAFYLRDPFQSLWVSSDNGFARALQVFTFQSVHSALGIVFPSVVFDPASFTVGTPRFVVIIGGACSGLEGLGLVLVFTISWLLYFRKESRFPQALLLIPCALAFILILNVVRICALIMIGDAGAPDVALFGFHSGAGWIAFTTVALVFSIATRKLAWVRRSSSPSLGNAGAMLNSTLGAATTVAEVQDETEGESPATSAYLVPFLAILAASFVSRASSGTFEWLYPLRFVAGGVAIWCFRGELKKLNWRFGWLAPIAGAAIFVLWIASDWRTHDTSTSTLGLSLAGLSPVARNLWIAFRIAAGLITVPICEELAFRGYLARRVMHKEFDVVSFQTITPVSIVISSVVFGLLYGQHWLAGILAGLTYAVVLKWRGRIGDAVVAHATSNLLLAAWVVFRGDWGQW
jgi:exosortase E/protease (VPEID-CTERM system)